MSNTPDVKIREWFEELWNKGREDTVDRLLAPGGKIHGLPTPGGVPLVGPKEFKAYIISFERRFPTFTSPSSGAWPRESSSRFTVVSPARIEATRWVCLRRTARSIFQGCASLGGSISSSSKAGTRSTF